MSLKERLLNDLKDAMKAKDTVRKDTIQLIRSAILQVEKDKHVTLGDDEIADILARELKNRREALSDIEKSGRADAKEKAEREIEIILDYMPRQLTRDELESIVREAIAETGAISLKDIGKVMKAVMPKVKGRADGSAVNEIVKGLLG
ncbi:MAG TPA: GatB/YqeY domain-containing protein [Thermoclostridium caenicola]|nr:GatB/YqeY domain-containing protein [Thermoclostridium caenicola]